MYRGHQDRVVNSKTKGPAENNNRGEQRKRENVMKVEEGWRAEQKRTVEDGGKATREVTSAVNNLSFKNPV